MKTPIAFMRVIITDKKTLEGTKVKLVVIVYTEMRPIGSAESANEGVIGCSMKHLHIG